MTCRQPGHLLSTLLCLAIALSLTRCERVHDVEVVIDVPENLEEQPIVELLIYSIESGTADCESAGLSMEAVATSPFDLGHRHLYHEIFGPEETLPAIGKLSEARLAFVSLAREEHCLPVLFGCTIIDVEDIERVSVVLTWTDWTSDEVPFCGLDRFCFNGACELGEAECECEEVLQCCGDDCCTFEEFCFEERCLPDCEAFPVATEGEDGELTCNDELPCFCDGEPPRCYGEEDYERCCEHGEQCW